MKKILCALLLITAFVFVFASCKDTDENPLGLAFFLKDDGTYAVEIGQAKYLSKIEIPATYKGKAVTEVGSFDSKILEEITIPNSVIVICKSAFSGCTALTSVTIPDGVTSIGDNAFEYCTSLTSITIPDSVTSIGDNAFRSCDALTSVHITDLAAWCNINFISFYSNPLCYAHNLYLNGNLVTALTIPDGVTSIGDSALEFCTSLTSVTIPDSVMSIGDSAFSGCTALTSITIPDSVTSIGDSAFRDCTSLTSITIPDSVTSIGRKVFYICEALTSVTFANPNGWWRAISANATSGTAIPADSLSNPATAAKYLKWTYCDRYWFRTE